MKKICALALAVIFCMGASASIAGEEKLPHYLKGWTRSHTELERMINYFDVMYKASLKTRQIPVIINGCEKRTIEIKGKKVELFFEPYHRKDANTIIYSDPLTSLDLTNKEFELVVSDLKETLERSVKDNFNHYHFVYDVAINAIATADNTTKAEAIKKIKGSTNGVPNADILMIPLLEETDFVPKELHLAFISSLGLTYLNSEIVLYDPQARIMDYIFSDSPAILKHELIHSNMKLQGMPFVWQYNAELVASLPAQLDLDMPALEFLYHPYLATIRDMSKVLFGLDSKKCFGDAMVFSYDGNIKINESALNECKKNLDLVRPALVKETETKILPEFFSNMFFWMAINNKMHDSTGFIQVIMARDFDAFWPFNDENKAKKWIETNKEVIDEIAKKTLEKIKGGDDSPFEGIQLGHYKSSVKALQGMYGFNEKQLSILLKQHGLTLEDVLKMNEKEIGDLYTSFINKLSNNSQETLGGLR